MGEEEKTIDAAAGALKRYLFRGLLVLLAVSLAVNGAFILIVRSTFSRIAQFEAEKIELSEKLKTIKAEGRIIYRDRERIVEIVVTNEIRAMSAGSNREKLEAGYSGAQSWADVVRVWSNHNP